MDLFEESHPLIFNEYIKGDQLGNIENPNLSALIVAGDVQGNINLGKNSTVVILGDIHGNIHAENIVALTEEDCSYNASRLKEQINNRIKEGKQWN